MVDLTETRRKVLDLERLPAMPLVAVRLLDALADDKTDAARLEEIIQSDQALAGKVLSLANSAYYGFSQKVTTIQRAVVAIGMRDLRLLSLGASLSGIFDPAKMPDRFDGEGLWIHCLAVSLTARELALAAAYPQPGELLVAGLLHDVGKLVTGAYLNEELDRLLDLVDKGRPYFEAEAETGLNHTAVGYWLAQKWGLPPVHVSVIRHHHQPRPSDPYHQAVATVALADYLTKKLNYGVAHEAEELNLPELVEAAGLRAGALAEIAAKMREQIPILIDAWQQIM